MNKLLNKNIFLLSFFISLFSLLSACGGGSGVGGNEDTTAGTVTLTSLNSGEEIIGSTNITWDNTEINRSSVEIEFSTDSGTTYIVVQSDVPDTGTFTWDSNSASDCRKCRIRITATDVVGNISEPVESSQDFIINNVPQVLGVAYYTDLNGDGLRDGDTIRVPFDKKINILTSIGSDIFELPVLGDTIGSFAEVGVSDTNPKELIVTMNNFGSSNFHLHVEGTFNSTNLGRTAPSGINLRKDISSGVIFAPDTGRTAAIAKQGIDILPTFAESTNVINYTGRTVALADVNSDGSIDIIDGGSGSNKIWGNNGAGSFTEIIQTPVLGSSTTYSIEVGDVNGDGEIDFVTGNSTANFVWLNDGGGTGTFTVTGQSLGSSSTRSIALGDINGDGHLDMVEGNFGQPNLVRLNDGTGNFDATGLSLAETDYTLSVTLGDIDGDGDLDLVEGNYGFGNNVVEGNRVRLNDGTGTFSSGVVLSSAARTTSVALGDIDGDGDLDLVEGNSNSDNLLWLNDGSGSFTVTNQTLGDTDTVSIAFSDIDGDDDLDLLVGNEWEGNNVYFNGGDSSGSNTGVFTDSEQSLGTTYTTSLALGDIDGDGDLDVVESNLNTNKRIWLNSHKHINDNLMIPNPQALAKNNTYTIALGDLDNDGDLDIVEGNLGEENLVWLNRNDSLGNSTGVFIDSNQELGTGGTTSVVLADLDSDGDLDIVEANYNEGNLVRINDGSGIFTSNKKLPGSDSEPTFSIAIGDVNGDDLLDIVEGNYGVSNRVLLNDGTGSFTAIAQAIGNYDTRSIKLTDIDGDKDLDMVEGNYKQPNRIWRNDGDGNFTDTNQTLVDSTDNYTTSIATGDIDGDGDIDFVEGTANPNGSNNKVWFNGGDNSGSNTGVFSNPLSLTVATVAESITYSVALADINNDGKLDMVVGNNGTANLVRLNTGKSPDVFTGNGISLLFPPGDPFSNATTSLALGDIDTGADGKQDIDIIMGNGNEQNQIGYSNRIWLNDF